MALSEREADLFRECMVLFTAVAAEAEAFDSIETNHVGSQIFRGPTSVRSVDDDASSVDNNPDLTSAASKKRRRNYTGWPDEVDEYIRESRARRRLVPIRYTAEEDSRLLEIRPLDSELQGWCYIRNL